MSRTPDYLDPKRRRVNRKAMLIAPSAVLLLWATITESGLIPGRFLPSPSRVVAAASDLEPGILTHSAATISIVVLAVPLATFLAIPIGLWMGRSRTVKTVAAPIIESWRPVPPVAIVPFFIMWFGFAWYAKVLLVSLGAFLIMIVGILEAMAQQNPTHLRIGLSAGATRDRFMWKVVLPGLIPQLLAPLRIAIAASLALAVIAEFMGATRGLGYVMNVAFNTYAMHTVMLCAIMLGIIGAGLDWLVRVIHRRLVPWSTRPSDVLLLSFAKELQ